MSKTTNILLLAKKPEQTTNLCFLLRLANFQAVQIADDTEAFNYLVQRQNSSQPLKLLLITDASSQQPMLQLINELERRNAMLPIVLIGQNEPLDLNQLNCHEHLKTMIKQCPRAAPHSYLQQILNFLAEVSVATSRHELQRSIT